MVNGSNYKPMFADFGEVILTLPLRELRLITVVDLNKPKSLSLALGIAYNTGRIDGEAAHMHSLGTSLLAKHDEKKLRGGGSIQACGD
ncbi:MAG: hypothetical protein JWN89_615 [Parcubacteria group bacterium]|nr:hypothetical protein [Parcubacteria group bacterium]